MTLNNLLISWDVDGNLATTDQDCRIAYRKTVRSLVKLEGLEVRHSDDEIMASLQEAPPGTGWPLFAISGAEFLKAEYNINIRPSTVELVFNRLWLRQGDQKGIQIFSAVAAVKSWHSAGATQVISTGSDLAFVHEILSQDILALFAKMFTRSTPGLEPKPRQQMADAVREFAGDKRIVHIGDTMSDVVFAERMNAVPVVVQHRYSAAGLRDANCLALSSHLEFLPSNADLLQRILNWPVG
jgi:phosphoglycolate phosphatase-like HAD superfamily hydrolase